mgnify:CR=1 FL=1
MFFYALAYGLRKGDTVYLAVFAPGTKDVEIPLTFGKETGQAEVIYPKKGNCEYYTHMPACSGVTALATLAAM